MNLQEFAANGVAAQKAVDAVTIEHAQDEVNDARISDHTNPTPLLCRSACRELFLDTAKKLRPFNKFNRVSEDTLVWLNAQVRQLIVARVKAQPSKGKTL